MTEEQKITLHSWNQFRTPSLAILPDLVGSEHHFPFGSFEARIRLPGSKHVRSTPGDEGPLSFHMWQEIEGIQVPGFFVVHTASVEVYQGATITLDPEVLKHPPNAYELLTDLEQRELEELASIHGKAAEQAFDLWIRTLRWKADDSAIGRPEVIGLESGWSTRMADVYSHKHLWIEDAVVRIGRHTRIDRRCWDAVRDSLRTGDTPPVHVELIHDATEHLKQSDLARAVVDLAMACEVFVRGLVGETLPANLRPEVRNLVEEANIRRVLSKMVPEVLERDQQTKLEKFVGRLHRLFDVRNEVVHKGKTRGLDRSECESFLDASRKLIAITDAPG